MGLLTNITHLVSRLNEAQVLDDSSQKEFSEDGENVPSSPSQNNLSSGSEFTMERSPGEKEIKTEAFFMSPL